MFRTQLILRDRVREIFESSLRLARESGYLKRRSMRVALDTSGTLTPASRERRPSTGPTSGHARRCWPAL